MTRNVVAHLKDIESTIEIKSIKATYAADTSLLQNWWKSRHSTENSELLVTAARRFVLNFYVVLTTHRVLLHTDSVPCSEDSKFTRFATWQTGLS